MKKYSYEEYVRTNIKLLKRNPKKYHKCIQNIIGWNVELGQSVSIDNYSDLDLSLRNL